MPVKICLITNYAYRLFNPASRINFGGIETIFYILARDLAADKRFKISFLLEDDVHKIPAREKINGITLYKTSRQIKPAVYQDKQIEKYHRYFVYWASKFNRLWQLPHQDFFRLWENLKQIKADIYIHASPSYESGLINIIVRWLGSKSIFMIANDEILDKNNFWGLKKPDIIWCLSDRHKSILKKRFNLDHIYIPCWYQKLKKSYPRKKRKYLLWIGRAEPRKYPLEFIRLAKILQQFKFLMIATEAPHHSGLYKNLIRSAKETSNLKLIKGVPLSQVDSYYQQAIAFIDTSGYKNLNMTQVQAAFGKVPGLTLFHDPNDSFKLYHWGLSANGSIEKLISNIKLVLTNKLIWQNLSSNAFKFAEEVYNPKINLPVFKKKIRDILK